MYGKSIEKSTLIIQDELDLFNEVYTLAEEDEKETLNIAEYKRRKNTTMDNLPKGIEREYYMYDLEDKSCPSCGKPLHKIRIDDKMELIIH